MSEGVRPLVELHLVAVELVSPLLFQPSYSTEELTNEMINLETVMKDLNAISGPKVSQQC